MCVSGVGMMAHSKVHRRALANVRFRNGRGATCREIANAIRGD